MKKSMEKFRQEKLSVLKKSSLSKKDILSETNELNDALMNI